MTEVNHERIQLAVQARYTRLADQEIGPAAGTSCCDEAPACGPSCYEIDVTHLPGSVTALSLGCGDPIALASLRPGQTVLDLGSGAGIDCFLAAERVGPNGAVIGVDMTPAMVERANRNRDKLGAGNVAFRLGQIEALPVETASVDVVISNCVINLSPDKAAVFREVFRVLKPEGRLAVSDMVTLGAFTAEQRADMDAWAACVAGAEDVAHITAMMAEAGFGDISIRDKAAPGVELSRLSPTEGPARLISAHITGRKPGQAS